MLCYLTFCLSCCSGQIHPLSPSAESPYAVVNKLRKKSLDTDVDFSSCSHQGCLFRRERFQWHKVRKWESVSRGVEEGCGRVQVGHCEVCGQGVGGVGGREHSDRLGLRVEE